MFVKVRNPLHCCVKQLVHVDLTSSVLERLRMCVVVVERSLNSKVSEEWVPCSQTASGNFTKLFITKVRLRTEMNGLDFEVKRSVSQ